MVSRCLVHVSLTRFPFAPLCLCLVEGAMSCHVMVPYETCSGQVISFECEHIKFGKFWLPGFLVHVCVAYFPYSPLCLCSVRCAMSRHVRAPNEMRLGHVISFRVAISNFLNCDWPRALCKFVWPICRLLHCAFVQLGAAYCAVYRSPMKHV